MSLPLIGRQRGRHRRLTSAEVAALHRQKDAATLAAIKYATEATELQQQLDEAGITISGLLEDLRVEREEGSRLKAALANATSVSVACGVRDIWPGEEPTHPHGLDVRTLRARFAGTDPAHVPGA
ncbi:hypothetical protein [Streptomyces erythrochromogenes]|uniref:hypothetical protein n=1 Tax=Streptomyces erythrochromogenes TaxID=285574 RepID=UPI0037D8A6B2